MRLKRRSAAVLGLAGLILGLMSTPATAADQLVKVNGHGDIAAKGMLPWSNKCGQPHIAASQNPTKLAGRTAFLGSSSLGWDFTVSGNEAGVLAFHPTPAAITDVDVRFESDGFVEGHAIALFNVNNNWNSGYYVGQSNQFSFDSRNGTTLQFSQSMSWYRVDGNHDVIAGWGRSKTIAQMAAEFGNQGGIYAGYVLGCNKNSFYLDDLTLGSSTDTWSYDLEATQTHAMAHIEYSLDGRAVRDGTVTIPVGKQVWALGHAHGHHDNVYFTGTGTLYERQFGRKNFRAVATGTFDPDFYASFKRTPKRRTVYYFATPGSSINTAASSEFMTVNVRADVRAKVLDRTLRQGQRITAQGKLKPGNKGTRIKLQRKAGRKWKTIAQGRTKRAGNFTISAKAGSPGRWKVRVLVMPGNGNLGTKTRKITVTVKKAAPPKPLPTDTDQGSNKPDDGYSTYTPIAKPPEPSRNPPSGGGALPRGAALATPAQSVPR